MNHLFLHTAHHDCAKMAVMILGFLGLFILDTVPVNLPEPEVQILSFGHFVSYVSLWFSCPRPSEWNIFPATCFSFPLEGWK